MKNLFNYLMIALLATAMVFTGCKDETSDPTVGNYQTLTNYMSANNLDLPALLSGWVIAPTLVADGGIVDADADYTIPGYHVFDIRGEADFNAGHVKGAINVALGDVLAKANEVGKDKPILVFCYSGQTAGRAVMALRLSGFPDAKVAKFGFSYWSSDTYDGGAKSFDRWTPKISDVADNDPNWVFDASAALPQNDYPSWTSTTTDGAALLAERVTAMLSLGWTTSSSDVLANPADYNIYNYWGQTDYIGIGHYKGAYQYTTIDLTTTRALPQSDECQIYCYTGQTSSITTAWLQVLGYNAKSITYGVNSMRHAAVDAANPKTAWHHSFDYPYETTTK